LNILQKIKFYLNHQAELETACVKNASVASPDGRVVFVFEPLSSNDIGSFFVPLSFKEAQFPLLI